MYQVSSRKYVILLRFAFKNTSTVDNFITTYSGEDDRCLQVTLAIRHSLQMSINPDTTRATTATRAGCARHGMSHKTNFSVCSSRNAAEGGPRTNTIQLNTEGLTANKISAIEQLGYKNKGFNFVLQATHCTTANKLVIPNFSLAGSVLSRNHGLATFVHE